MRGIGFVIEDVHLAVANLHDVDMARIEVTGLEGQRNVEGQCGAVVVDVLVGEDDRHLDGDRGRVVHEHELLEGLVTKFVLGDSLKGEPCALDGGVVVPLGNADVSDAEDPLGLRCARRFLEEERVRTGLRNRVQVGAQRVERFVPAMSREEEIGLRAVVLEVVDLAMKEAVLEDGFACGNGVPSRGLAQAQEGKVLGKLLQPIPCRRRRYPHAKFFADASDGVGERVESVVSREDLDDNPHRIRSVSRGAGGEPSVAEVTPIELHRSVLGDARAVLGDRCSFAIWAGESRFTGMARRVDYACVASWGRAGWGRAGHVSVVGCLRHTIPNQVVKSRRDFGA